MRLPEQAQIRCWYAPRNIAPGAIWAQSISGAIENAGLVLLILSAQSAKSVQVMKEVSLARGAGRPLVVLSAAKADVSALWDDVGDGEWLEAIGRPFYRSMDALHKMVCAKLGRPYQKVRRSLWGAAGQREFREDVFQKTQGIRNRALGIACLFI